MLLLSHDGHQTVLSTTVTGKSVQLGAVQDVNMTATTVAGNRCGRAQHDDDIGYAV